MRGIFMKKVFLLLFGFLLAPLYGQDLVSRDIRISENIAIIYNYQFGYALLEKEKGEIEFELELCAIHMDAALRRAELAYAHSVSPTYRGLAKETLLDMYKKEMDDYNEMMLKRDALLAELKLKK
jgi:hypothetical protein